MQSVTPASASGLIHAPCFVGHRTHLSVPMLLLRLSLIVRDHTSIISPTIKRVVSNKLTRGVEVSNPGSGRQRLCTARKFTNLSDNQQRRQDAKTGVRKSIIMSTEESTFKTRDGTTLYTKTWKVSQQATWNSQHGFNNTLTSHQSIYMFIHLSIQVTQTNRPNSHQPPQPFT
jgi:hypothetical protein